ncbi:lactococcin 972 family bacteriocin [Streptomyces kebangsaanensis]|uniref:lactococcin 972 family bacteriocin n=1 Tax=Streptomyces kebangsaanensis TaxID=864058 RepID=UPI001300D9EB|nr:lactococcin 972 family bacteriocin [Streptomyces kebangsaanensis]
MAIFGASVAVAAGILASPASAATFPPPPEMGDVSEWGMVEITADASSPVTTQTTKDVGGGSWTYGTEIVAGGKRCYSYYFHGTYLHRATAEIAGGSHTAGANPGVTAKASKTAGAAWTCYAYWGVTKPK